MCVLGAIGSGKSSYGYSLLNTHYARYFDEVIVLCGTIDSKSSWESLNQKKVVFMNEYDEKSFQDYLDQLEEDQEDRKKKGKFPVRVALVMDDVVFQNLSKNRVGTIERLMMITRHLNVSIILMLQHSKQVSPAMRNNIMYWVLFRLTQNDLEKVASEHGNLLSKDQFINMYADCMKEGKHEFMIINYRKPMHERFSHRFTKIIDQENYKSS